MGWWKHGQGAGGEEFLAEVLRWLARNSTVLFLASVGPFEPINRVIIGGVIVVAALLDEWRNLLKIRS